MLFCQWNITNLLDVTPSTADSRDLVIDVQQAMACIALTFHPGMICFEPQNTVLEAVTHSDSDGQTPKRWPVGCFNITASLDHLDYDCVVVAGSVYVLGQCAKWSFRQAYFHFWSVRRMSPFRSPFRILQ